MNAVRSQLCRVKGGGLLAALREAGCPRAWTLVLSDVIGDDPAVIGSGPTVPPDSSTGAAQRALGVVRRFRMRDRLPAPVMDRLEQEASREQPGSGDASHHAARSPGKAGSTEAGKATGTGMEHLLEVVGSNRLAV